MERFPLSYNQARRVVQKFAALNRLPYSALSNKASKKFEAHEIPVGGEALLTKGAKVVRHDNGWELISYSSIKDDVKDILSELNMN